MRGCGREEKEELGGGVCAAPREGEREEGGQTGQQ